MNYNQLTTLRPFSDSLCAPINRSAKRPDLPAALVTTFLWLVLLGHPAFVAICEGQELQCEPAPQGLVAWWRGGGNANDTVSTNHGTLQNGATFAAGMVGQAFNLDGIDDFVEIPNSPSVSLAGAITIEAWIKPTQVASGTVASKYDSSISQLSWGFLIVDGGRLRFSLHGNGSYRYVDSTDSVVVPGVFSHVAGTFDPVTQAIKLYVNGTEAAAPPGAGSTTVPSLFESTTPVRLGVFVNSFGQFDAVFRGLLDEVSIFNRALTPNEISAIYAAGGAGMCGPDVHPCSNCPPAIVAQPISRTIFVGGSVSFNVAASGTAPLSYRWLKEGVAIPGATSASYQILNAQTNNTGRYSVLVSNLYGSSISSNALLTVLERQSRYVNLNNRAPTPPYTSWASAATNIQQAIDVALDGDEIVVTNGVYETGGRIADDTTTNRAAVTKPLIVRSVNGPAVTVIRGNDARCAYLTSGATLLGFTLTNGTGGGVSCASASSVVSNCVISGNSSYAGGGVLRGTLYNCTLTGNSASVGGGAYFATLNNCVLQGNLASDSVGVGAGGGAYCSTLNNCILAGNVSVGYCDEYGFCYGGGGASLCRLNLCTLTDNHALVGGGAADSSLNNCIVYFNVSDDGANYSGSTFNYSCTTPIPDGVGNITNAPVFVNQAGGNLRLQSNSPCINAGNNAYTPGGIDLDGRSRIVGGTVDIGAYEFQSPQSLISYAWLQQYGLPINAATDSADSDGDRLNNYQEWRAGTNPTNTLSVLQLKAPLWLGSGLVVTWESVAGRSYFVEGSTNPASPESFHVLATSIPGQAGTTAYTHTNAAGAGLYFYRVGVE